MTDHPTAYPDNPIQAIMWAGAVKWAALAPHIQAQYTRETGRPAVRPADPDGEAQVAAFISWFNARIWGEDPFRRRPSPEPDHPPGNPDE